MALTQGQVLQGPEPATARLISRAEEVGSGATAFGVPSTAKQAGPDQRTLGDPLQGRSTRGRGAHRQHRVAHLDATKDSAAEAFNEVA
jgi:hypothetical protein